jgi:thiamine pyrophosphate-dependent acetolactate synthase large subunit-like protein
VSQLTGGQALVRSLEWAGARTVFGPPGTPLDRAFDAATHDGPTLVEVALEQPRPRASTARSATVSKRLTVAPA